MKTPARPARDADAEPLTPQQEALVRAATLWINQFARTLKTCRLYDGNNPAVVRFRAELYAALSKLVIEHGTMRFHFTADDVLCEGQSLYPARSRDDNMSLAFYRDGVRAVTFVPGVEMRELDTLLDAVLQVTGPQVGDDDLVTLLWEAALVHIEIDYVPAEGDLGSGGAQSAAPDDNGPLLPWPSGGAGEGTGVTDEHGATGDAVPEKVAEDDVSPEIGKLSRSDDWNAGDLTVEIEAGFEELQALSTAEVARFRREFDAEHSVDLVIATIATAHAYLRAGSNPDDRVELARFLPRVLRQSVSHARWPEAREALKLQHECGSAEWSVDTFVQELLQPISVSSTVERLDQQGEEDVTDFIALSRELGDPGVDWLNLVLAESQNRKHRRLLAEAIAQICRAQPERLAPWISDPRWFVVRNVVHILGWIGGSEIIGMLQVALRNPDPRVRQEVVAALGQVEPRLARPMLVRMLDGADTRMFCAVLHQLSVGRDPSLARLLMGYMQDPAFETRPQEEKHATYAALAATAGDEAIPDLEAELHKGNWFARNQDAHRVAVARIIARIGTPLSRLVLERGAQSKRMPVRKACEEGLMAFKEAA